MSTLCGKGLNQAVRNSYACCNVLFSHCIINVSFGPDSEL